MACNTMLSVVKTFYTKPVDRQPDNCCQAPKAAFLNKSQHIKLILEVIHFDCLAHRDKRMMDVKHEW